jgi:predicted dienelactone hydrolase
MRIFISLAFIALANLAFADAATTQAATQTSSLGYDFGPTFEVQTMPRAELTDSLRNKMIPLLIEYPKVDHPSPVIIFSHGSGSAGNAYANLLAFWASHGYVCIAPTHAESQSLQDPSMQSFRGSMNDASVISSNWGDRVRDITTILENLNKLQEFYPSLKDTMDVTHVGVAGHAFGAYTAQLVGGATIKLSSNTPPQRLWEKHVQAVLLFDPQGADQQGLTKDSWKDFETPLMAITGNELATLRGRGADWKLQPFSLSPAGDKYGAIIAGANHFSFSGRLAGQTKANGKPLPSGKAYDAVKVLSQAFWDAYLKRDANAKTYLQSDTADKNSDGMVKLQHR